MEHGMAAPAGGVHSGLNPAHQTADVLEHRGQGPPPQLLPLHGPWMSTQTTPPRKKELPRESVALPTEAVSNGHRYKSRHPFQGAARGDTSP